MRVPVALTCLFLAAAAVAWSSDSHATQYAAIAFNKQTGAYGYGYEFETRAEAEEEALDNCEGHCQIVVWVRNSCAALAVGSRLGYGIGYHASRAGAEAIAMKNCRAYDGYCAVKVWTCSGT
jgi:serine/threonine-protein kinase